MSHWIGLTLLLIVFVYGARVIMISLGYRELAQGITLLAIIIVIKSAMVTLTPYTTKLSAEYQDVKSGVISTKQSLDKLNSTRKVLEDVHDLKRRAESIPLVGTDPITEYLRKVAGE